MEEETKLRIKIWIKIIVFILLLGVLIFVGACFTTININGLFGGGLIQPYNTIMNWFFDLFLLIIVILIPYLLIKYFRNSNEENKKILIYALIIIFVIWLAIWFIINYFHCLELLQQYGSSCSVNNYILS